MKEFRGEAMDDPFSSIEYSDNPNIRADMLRFISELSVNQRMALLSYYYGGFTIQEVAIAMKVPVSTATNHLESARDNVIKAFSAKSATAYIPPDVPQKSQVLMDILDGLCAESVTDEQVQRVLEPVLKMIREGKFDAPWWSRFAWRKK